MELDIAEERKKLEKEKGIIHDENLYGW